jgi:hypothetical protein
VQTHEKFFKKFPALIKHFDGGLVPGTIGNTKDIKVLHGSNTSDVALLTALKLNVKLNSIGPELEYVWIGEDLFTISVGDHVALLFTCIASSTIVVSIRHPKSTASKLTNIGA